MGTPSPGWGSQTAGSCVRARPGQGWQALRLPEAWAPLGPPGPTSLGQVCRAAPTLSTHPLGAHAAPGLTGAQRSVGNSESPSRRGQAFRQTPEQWPGLGPLCLAGSGSLTGKASVGHFLGRWGEPSGSGRIPDPIKRHGNLSLGMLGAGRPAGVWRGWGGPAP